MTQVRNPKQAGSILFDCIPQVGPCPNNCNQCYYNRPGAFYVPIDKPFMPNPATLPLGAVVRVNSGHDSNIEHEKVIADTACYEERFFNTSIPRFNFPAPVVLTANPREEGPAWTPGFHERIPPNLMYVRLRVSTSNLRHVSLAVDYWTSEGVPVVLTFMRYWNSIPKTCVWPLRGEPHHWYEWKENLLNEYWCPTASMVHEVMAIYRDNRQVFICTGKCADCGVCVGAYWLAKKRMSQRTI